MEKERRILISFGAAALLGLLAGVAAPKLFHMGDGSYAGFFSLYSFGKFAQLPDSDFTQLFWYLLVKRLRLICFLWMSSYTPFGFFAHLLLLFWIFFAGGMLLSLFLLREGTNGILLFLCCLLPQWILYILAFRGELRLYFSTYGMDRKWDCGIISGRESEPRAESPAEYGRATRASDFEKTFSGWMRRELLSMLMLCTVGCGMEAFIGLRLLQVIPGLM